MHEAFHGSIIDSKYQLYLDWLLISMNYRIKNNWQILTSLWFVSLQSFMCGLLTKHKAELPLPGITRYLLKDYSVTLRLP